MIRWWVALLALVAGGWLGYLGAVRQYDARAQRWRADRDSLTLALGIADAEQVQRDAESARWQGIADSLAGVIAAQPVPAPRPRVAPPHPNIGTPSDSAAYWRGDALASRARADSLAADGDLLRAAITTRDAQLAATAHLLALSQASDSVHLSQRDSALALVRRAPVGAPRCRLLALIPCPVIVGGYSGTLVDGALRFGPSVTAGWTIRL